MQETGIEKIQNAKVAKEILEYCLDLLAVHTKPEVVAYYAKQKFGEKAPTIEQLYKFKLKYKKAILQRRQEISFDIPILDPVVRWRYLQEIYDSAENNRIKLESLKLANQMTKQEVNDDDEIMIKRIVIDTFRELKALQPEKTTQEIIIELSESLGIKAIEYLEEIEHVEEQKEIK